MTSHLHYLHSSPPPNTTVPQHLHRCHRHPLVSLLPPLQMAPSSHGAIETNRCETCPPCIIPGCARSTSSLRLPVPMGKMQSAQRVLHRTQLRGEKANHIINAVILYVHALVSVLFLGKTTRSSCAPAPLLLNPPCSQKCWTEFPLPIDRRDIDSED